MVYDNEYGQIRVMIEKVQDATFFYKFCVMHKETSDGRIVTWDVLQIAYIKGVYYIVLLWDKWCWLLKKDDC